MKKDNPIKVKKEKLKKARNSSFIIGILVFLVSIAVMNLPGFWEAIGVVLFIVGVAFLFGSYFLSKQEKELWVG